VTILFFFLILLSLHFPFSADHGEQSWGHVSSFFFLAFLVKIQHVERSILYARGKITGGIHLKAW
jgi:hypothetical protein